MKTRIYLLVLLFLFSCSPKEIQIEERSRFASSAQAELMGPLLKAPQSFSINNQESVSIEGDQGTKIFIPQGAFVNKRGELVTENIAIELVEVYELKDFISNDLTTLSGDRLLQSAGMIYLDAQANGETLTLQEGMSLHVEIPYSDGQPGYRMFSGVRDNEGKMDWELQEDSREEMIPLPLDSLNFRLYKTIRFRSDNGRYEGENTLDLNDLKYENTFVATEAFEDRLWMIRDLYFHGEYLWAYETRGLWEKAFPNMKVVVENGDTLIKPDISLLNIYLKNLDKNLAEVDAIVFPLMKEIMEKQYEVTQEFYESNNRQYFREWLDWRMRSMDNFLKANLGKVSTYDPRGVDMEAENARELLIGKGYTELEASNQMRIHQRRSDILESRALRFFRFSASDSTISEYEKTLTRAFKVERLGWINCDRFYDDPRAKPVELYVKLEKKYPESQRIVLMLPDMNLALSPTGFDQHGYYFGFEPDKAIRLPIGRKAALIAMAKSEDAPLFALESFEIEEEHRLNLELKPTSYEIMEKRLSALK